MSIKEKLLGNKKYDITISADNEQTEKNKENFDYNDRPILREIPVIKRKTKRHFGVHGYFTRQSWNVVAKYINNYTKKGDLVLDPFGGSGITAIEALMNERRAINVDLNPFAIFLVESLAAPVELSKFADAFSQVKEEYLKHEPKTKEEIEEALKKYKGVKSLPLPKGSDAATTEGLFSDKQKARLALLKHIIKKQKNKNIKETLLLCFSGLITKANLTYHTSNIGGGDAAAFRYYRYRIAPNPTDIDLMKYFELRYKKVAEAKKDIAYFINENTINNLRIIKGTATNLFFIDNESVDYIYTDPPYGNKIPYLDLSVMWYAWLDLEVTENDYELEAIEGGEHNKTKNEYNDLIAKSIKEMYRVLKYDRWMSFVFAHKDPEFWHLIMDTAESCGFEYMGAVSQKNGQTSFKKRQKPFTVLSGQLIINFKKTRNPAKRNREYSNENIEPIVIQTIEGVIAKNDGATLEQINDELIMNGMDYGFLHLLKKYYDDLMPLLNSRFDYDEKTETFHIPKKRKFMTHIDEKLRIRYYATSFLRRREREAEKLPTFDEIVFEIMPSLRNGKTPENQTILSVLEEIAERINKDCWRLKKAEPNLFDYGEKE
ncbi:MAG: hypothetical protein LBU73_04985 [Helicobacteraceae bacterium]|jgi:DNA modification methylase|nr:hypothetical protein [Helicobacteraceae bacterium]